MDFRFIFAGKSKDPYIIQGIDKYRKILKKYGKVDIVEVKDTSDRILKSFRTGSFKIILDIKGEEPTSEELALKFRKWTNSGYSKFDFLTGGPYGLEDDVLEKADFIWKLSNLTFNHQIVRIILLEQIYRAMSILNNESYHH